MNKTELQELPLNQIHAKNNYRKTFGDEGLKELAKSIKENGVIEPIIVRPNGQGFVIIAGERRFRAATMVKLATIPAVIRDVTDAEVLRMQIVENVQREGVPFMEEAAAVARLRDELGLDVTEISGILGKSEVWVYQMLRLTQMHPEARRLAEGGCLSRSVSILIASLKHDHDQLTVAEALARTHKGKLVDVRYARQYIEQNIAADGRKKKTRKNAVQKANGNDYCANWKKYLVRFSVEQFEEFKTIVRGRTDVPTLSEAVETVMLGHG